MDKTFHFIAGLPRSGSTLLGALLRQNPALHAGLSGPLGAIVSRVVGVMSPHNEFSTRFTLAQRRNVLRGLVESYYQDIPAPRVIFDTNRVWCSKLPLIAELYPDARTIVCVRDPAWIMDSFERIVRRNALCQSRLFKPDDALTVFSRVAALGAPGGTVGFAWNATQEAFYGEHASRLIVVDYEALARQPRRAMEAIYRGLGLAPFEHDFETVAFSEGEDFDAGLGLPGLHAVGRRVEFVERATILPPELFGRFSGRSFWRRTDANPHNVAVILPDPQDRSAAETFSREPTSS